jgi:hypothetical protein
MLISIGDALSGGDLGVPALLVVVFFCDPEKFCTILDHVHRYDGSRTTFLRHRGVGWVSFHS